MLQELQFSIAFKFGNLDWSCNWQVDILLAAPLFLRTKSVNFFILLPSHNKIKYILLILYVICVYMKFISLAIVLLVLTYDDRFIKLLIQLV